MKIKIRIDSTDNRKTMEVDVPDDVGFTITESYRLEDNYDRKCRYHNYSSDALEYEGKEYAAPETPESLLMQHFDSSRVKTALSHLTDTQRRRLLLYASGKSTHDIARAEGANQKSVFESVEAAKRKFIKFF